MTFTKEQDRVLQKAFMTAMARKLYREGVIDVHKLNKLVIGIDKVSERKEETRA